MKFSNDALEVIRHFEGKRNVCYFDDAGVPTCGYGHTRGISRVDAATGRRVSDAQVEAWLRDDVAIAAGDVDSLVRVPLKQYQYDALVSWTFNFGYANLKSSTLLRKLNAKDYEGAAKEFLRWNKIKNPKTGKYEESNGLTRRRTTEKVLFAGEGLRFWHS